MGLSLNMCMRSEKIIIVRSAWAVLCLGLVLFAGCNKPGIEVYTVQSLPPRVTVPEGWKEVSIPKGFGTEDQKQRFEITRKDGNATAIATLTVSPGRKDMSMEQYLLINVNRWRGQLDLAALPKDAEIEDYLKRLPELSETAWLMDANGTSPTNPGEMLRTLAVLNPMSNATWIYKLSGDDGVVRRERATFIKMVSDWK